MTEHEVMPAAPRQPSVAGLRRAEHVGRVAE
jgi:hypothetical protein